MLAMLLSCENDMLRVYEVTQKDTLPIVSSFNMDAIYTEMGRLQFRIKAPVALGYTGEDSYQEFPQGFSLIFFDSLMNPKTELTADYGISYDRTKTMEARRNVEVHNYDKNERINTEYMVWDQQQKIIYSNVFVKITTKTNVIYGENGFEADESFNNWVIKKPTGEIEVEKN